MGNIHVGLGDAMASARETINAERRWRESTPLIVADQDRSWCKGWARGPKPKPEHRYRLMRLGYLSGGLGGSERKETPDKVYDGLRNWDGLPINLYRVPDANTLREVEAIDVEIAVLNVKRGLLLAERFMTWPLLTPEEIVAARATRPKS